MVHFLANSSRRGTGLNTFKASKRKVSAVTLELNIESISEQGQGIAKHHGKVVFVRGAMVGERVTATVVASHKNYDQAVCKKVLQPSSARQQARCEHFTDCGGCQLQHIDYRAQLAFKSELAISKLQHLLPALDRATVVAEPINSAPFGYRHRARMSVSADKGGCTLGFKKSGSHTIAAIRYCDVLMPALAALIPVLQQLISRLKKRSFIQQLLLLEDSSGALFVQLMGSKALPDEDIAALADYSASSAVQLQYYDSSSVLTRWRSSTKTPYYRNASLGLGFEYDIDDFTQVNPQVNEAMIKQALCWLDLSAADRVADFFCGMGNISLAMAGSVASLQGYELDNNMVEKARVNAQANDLGNCAFEVADLFSGNSIAASGLSKVVLDPPRAGAELLCRQLAQWPLESILYISCNGATFFRDAEILLAAGYAVTNFGLLDMFPQTEHVEMMALFERPVTP